MQPNEDKEAADFSKKVGEKAQRKLKALHNDNRGIWMGVGMMGIVGWTVVVPTVLGALLGIWLDQDYPQTFSWTLSGLIIGLFLGCIIAWNWLNKEHKEINQNNDDE